MSDKDKEKIGYVRKVYYVCKNDSIMKKWICTMICLLAALNGVYAQLLVMGVVKDKQTKAELANVNVAVQGTSMGTVTNADGVFSLKVSSADMNRQLSVSHVGYRNALVPLERLAAEEDGKRYVVWMEPSSISLGEISIFGGSPADLVERAISKIADNYPKDAHQFSAFYRETIQKGRRYIGVSEAVADVYKTGYRVRDISHDRVQLQKGRRIQSQKRSDTLAVKIMGGPNIAAYLDAAKNSDDLLTADMLQLYHFQMLIPTNVDGRMHYAVGFQPRVSLDYALYRGVLYIDQESLTISRAEYELDMSDRNKATRYILRKKPAGLRFKPQAMTFLVNYRQQGGRSYLHYVRSEIRFKCDWRKRLFSSTFTTTSEMVMVDRTDRPEERIRARDAFGRHEVFYDVVQEYWNEDFWREYNIIEPTESLETAVKKLKRQQKK